MESNGFLLYTALKKKLRTYFFIMVMFFVCLGSGSRIHALLSRLLLAGSDKTNLNIILFS